VPPLLSPPSASVPAFRAPVRDRGRARGGMGPGGRRRGLAAAAIALVQVSPSRAHILDGVLYWRRGAWVSSGRARAVAAAVPKGRGFFLGGVSVMLWGLEPA
jgi:hypothetical protein